MEERMEITMMGLYRVSEWKRKWKDSGGLYGA